MKKKLLLGVLLICSIASFAQDKASLTKEETVRYLDKKFKEIISSRDGKVYTDASCSLEGSKLKIFIELKFVYKGEDASIARSTITIDPSKIERIQNGTEGTEINMLIINVTSNTSKLVLFETASDPQPSNFNYWNKKTTTTVPSKIEIPYLKYDGTNFDKIKKALEHLKDLCKAEDDPFGE
jgi:hypothetical protein